MLKWVLGWPYALRTMYRAFLGKWITERYLHARFREYRSFEGAGLSWGVDGWTFRKVDQGPTLSVYDLHQVPGWDCFPEEADPHHWN